jgi:hypothetical protein
MLAPIMRVVYEPPAHIGYEHVFGWVDIVEALLSQPVPIDEWHWALGKEDGRYAGQRGSCPQSSRSVSGTSASGGYAIYADQLLGLRLNLEKAPAISNSQSTQDSRDELYLSFDWWMV